MQRKTNSYSRMMAQRTDRFNLHLLLRKFQIFRIVILALLVVGCGKDVQQLSKVEAKQIAIDSTTGKVDELANFIEPYKKSLDQQMNEALAYNPVSMHKNDTPYNTAIGNLMTRIVYEQAAPIYQKRIKSNIDLVLLNHGGIRAPISEGPVTMRTAYEVMPFENQIVVAQLKGTAIMEMVDYLTKSSKPHPFQGLKIMLDKNDQLQEVLLNGKPINAGETYHVATSDYLYNGGDNMVFFSESPITRLDYKIRNAMIDYFRKTDTIKASADDRFIKL
ncbi:5'-nucleotidase C-terminal domain-containing protein [Nonlabens xiamenensis]|uniref:5'-nucleotidase C-terminal domain-containing protein n=1 Tax=Nonlabens xiamenensis TaxID=2341043 RepID=UPI000F611E05|nr:5'-nucleotidase [Nonlabens xiamenensis]